MSSGLSSKVPSFTISRGLVVRLAVTMVHLDPRRPCPLYCPLMSRLIIAVQRKCHQIKHVGNFIISLIFIVETCLESTLLLVQLKPVNYCCHHNKLISSHWRIFLWSLFRNTFIPNYMKISQSVWTTLKVKQDLARLGL